MLSYFVIRDTMPLVGALWPQAPPQLWPWSPVTRPPILHIHIDIGIDIRIDIDIHIHH